jgi:two-component system response regulator YesN
LGLDLVARYYIVVAIKLESADGLEQLAYLEYQRIQQLISGVVANNPDVFLLQKDVDELVLVIKGNSPENLLEERELILARAKQAVEQTRCEMIVGSGAPENRISDISRSFIAATEDMQDVVSWRNGALGFEKDSLLKAHKPAVEHYLRSGTAEGMDALFESFVRPLGERALRSPIVKAFIFTDIVLATARFVDELGGDTGEVVPELDNLETVVSDIEGIEQLREKARAVLLRALSFRDSRVLNQYAEVIQRAQELIGRHYTNPNLSLTGVAAQVNLSACHFSAVFSQETGHTFKAYLTETRIKKAKELLRTTALKTFEIGYQVGYSDPHYFSHVFHKITGLTPTEFRTQVLMK